jgi:putative ABC transport system permease protein
VIRLSGRARSSLIIGVQGIRARKLRTLLSMISLFLGVLAVVTVQAAGQIIERTELANIELQMGRDGIREMYLPGDATVLPIVDDTLRGRTDAVAVTTLSAVIGEPGVTPVNPGGAPFDQAGFGGPYGPDFGPAPGQYFCDARGCREVTDGYRPPPPGQAIELQVSSLTGDVRRFKPFRHVAGDWLDFADKPALAPRLVINKEAAKGFGRYEVPARMRIDGAIADATPRIIGVVDDGQGMPMAYLRADELANWLPLQAIAARGVGLQLLMEPDTAELEQTLRARVAARGMPADMVVSNVVNAREPIEDSLALFRAVFLAMAGLVLLIGVAGVINVGLATVGERVEEFALRRAVGTPRLVLASIVLAETMLTGLFTAGAAIGAGILGLKIIGPFVSGRGPFPQDLDFPWQAGMAGVIAGLVAGLLGGLIPAIRAARIPIAAVMRA